MIRRRVAVVALVAVALSASAVASAAPAARGKPVLVIPIGSIDPSLIGIFAQTMRTRLGLQVRIGRRLALSAGVRNPARKQIVAELVVGYIRAHVREARSDRVAVIGLTDEDMYPRDSDWRWSFAERNGRTGVVSVARMDPRTFDLEPNRPLLVRRLQKYAVRYGALLAYGSAGTIDPRSALYGGILSVDDLDGIEPVLTPRPYSAARRAWLARAGAACRETGPVWHDVAERLRSASGRQALPALRRWAAADAALGTRLRAGSSTLPAAVRRSLLGSLDARSAYLRRMGGSVGALQTFDLRHMRSLGGLIHAGFVEAGSKPCSTRAS